MLQSQQLEQAELDKLNSLQMKAFELTSILGSLDYEIHQITQQKLDILKGLDELTKEKNLFFEELRVKHGDAAINLETGELTTT